MNGQLYEVETPATVYFVPVSNEANEEELAEKTKLLIKKSRLGGVVDKGKLVAIKQHFGEEGAGGYIKPEITKVFVDLVLRRQARPVVVETNTLYVGKRSNSYDHLMLAQRHGFSIDTLGAPVLIMDGINGQSQDAVRIPGKHFQQVYMVSDLRYFGALLVLSHVKGHMVAGMGGAIKNLAMGFSSRAGKLAQHSDFKPHINRQKCVLCGFCKDHCPTASLSIIDGMLNVDLNTCIGCGECFVACPHGAMSFDWDSVDRHFQEKMAEHAFAAVINHHKKASFVNYFCHISRHCDCWGGKNPRIPENVGLFASSDPVAIDKASYDMGIEVLGRDVFREFWPKIDPLIQIQHGEAIGMGSQDYHLVSLN